MIVVSSWLFAFHALKHLPLTIATPIQATGPIWTLVGAILIFQEDLNLMQWAGVTTTRVFFYLLSTAGKLEGINFRKNRWILFIITGTLLFKERNIRTKGIYLIGILIGILLISFGSYTAGCEFVAV